MVALHLTVVKCRQVSSQSFQPSVFMMLENTFSQISLIGFDKNLRFTIL